LPNKQCLFMKILLDSGSPQETKEALRVYPELAGQTTNPSLVASHPEVSKCRLEGRVCSADEVSGYYREIVEEIDRIIPDREISVEVHVERSTAVDDIVSQARSMVTWGSNIFIKLPVTASGLEAATVLSSEGICLNLTLVFTQSQALAVHQATLGASRGSVVVSPFVGRLEDSGFSGLDLVSNIVSMFKELDSHVMTLGASVRDLSHLQGILGAEAEKVTVPLNILNQVDQALSGSESEPNKILSPIPFVDLPLDKDWKEYSLEHPLTESGLDRFVDDWNKLIG